MGSEEDEATIVLAVKTLEKHIHRMIQKSQRSPSKLITQLLHHTKHLLLDLARKRNTLQAFLQWFQGEWSRIECHLADHPLLVLQHAMQHYLRCQDGLVLLTSGECRHDSDISEAQRTPYPSRLPTLKERNDGYTKLYAGECYSGTGWDEFHNEQVGIKVLLIQALQKYHKSPWEYLENKGATDLMESVWDQHESSVKELQQLLQSLKQRMLANIQQRLQPRNLKFATQDKMERLSLVVKSQTIDLQRRANAFQILGPVLPSGKQRPEDWIGLALELKNDNNAKMECKRRRLVMASSDSEGDDDNNGEERVHTSNSRTKHAKDAKSESVPTPNKARGLVVSVKDMAPTPSSKGSSSNVALNQIKTQMGVNAKELEDARESLEVEDNVLRQSLEENNVSRLKQVLQRVLSRKDVDEDEVWDARECLRLAHMEAGNYLLWETPKGSEKARAHFEGAKVLVEEQQQAHRRMLHRSDSDSTMWEFLNRNLYYLQGQANVNIGISMIESLKGSVMNKESKCLKSIPKLQTAKECAAKIRSKINPAAPSSLEEALDLLKADQLEALANRWIAKAFWMARQEDRAIDILQKTAFLMDKEKLLASVEGLEDDVLDLIAECLYAVHLLVDVACSQLEGFSRSAVPKGDVLIETVKRSLLHHNQILDIMHQNYDNEFLEQFLLEKDIPTAAEIDNYMKIVVQRWNLLKDQRNRPLSDSSNPRQKNKRSDLSSAAGSNVEIYADQTGENPIMPSWANLRQRQRSQRLSKTSAPNGTERAFLANPSSESLSIEPVKPQQYRPWGDELFWLYYEEKHGKVADKSSFPYPSCAPPMPEDFL